MATYTPRLVAFDVRGSSGTIPPSGVLYQAPPQSADESIIQTWGGQKAVYRSHPIEKNAFLKSLDEEEGEASERGQHESGMEIDGEAEAREADLARVAGLEDSVQYWTDYLKVSRSTFVGRYCAGASGKLWKCIYDGDHEWRAWE